MSATGCWLRDGAKLGCYRPDAPPNRDKLPLVPGARPDKRWLVSVLDEAAKAVHGARGKDYGAPHVNHGCTAAMMQAFLRRRYGPEAQFDALDTCAHNLVQKLSRLANTPSHHDSQVDIAGYIANWEMILEKWSEAGESLQQQYVDLAGDEE